MSEIFVEGLGMAPFFDDELPAFGHGNRPLPVLKPFAHPSPKLLSWWNTWKTNQDRIRANQAAASGSVSAPTSTATPVTPLPTDASSTPTPQPLPSTTPGNTGVVPPDRRGQGTPFQDTPDTSDSDSWDSSDAELDQDGSESWGGLSGILDDAFADYASSIPDATSAAAPSASDGGGSWLSTVLQAVPSLTTSYARIKAADSGNINAALEARPGIPGGFVGPNGPGRYPTNPGAYPGGAAYSPGMSSTTKTLLLVGAAGLAAFLLLKRRGGRA